MTDFIKKGDKYYCPFDCGDSRFPKPKWKTEKGAQKHVDNCSMRPEKVEERKVAQEIKDKMILNEKNKQSLLDKEKLKTAKYCIGDEISFVSKLEVKPTHEWRGTRMVKVRYEPEYSYSARKIIIDKITCEFGRIIYNNICLENQISESFNKAESDAINMHKAHLSANKLASDLR